MAPKLPHPTRPTNAVAPSATWINASGNLANMPSECGNLTLVSADPWSGRIIAGVAAKGLYYLDVPGGLWAQLGTNPGSAALIHRPNSILWDPDDPNRFWESGIYAQNGSAGAYVTTNRGSTFTQLGNISHNDFISVDMFDTARRTMLASGHEQVRTIHRSTDGGATWTGIGGGLPPDSSHSSYVLVLDSDSYLVGACSGWYSAVCGVWRTHDAGATWTASASAISPYGAPLWHSSGKIYWPVVGNGLAVSQDGGVTWTSAANGVYSPVELPDGRMLAVGNGRIVVSSNGRDWTPVGNPLPFQPWGMTYSTWTKTIYIWHWDCGATVLSDAIASAGFDWQ